MAGGVNNKVGSPGVTLMAPVRFEKHVEFYKILRNVKSFKS